MELNDFLVRAKRNTYASGKKPKILDDGFEELTYEEGEFFYRDRWKGSNHFGGEEIVKRNRKTIWLMNYYGGLITNAIESEEIYNFLRKAISLVKFDRPFRGPSNFKEEDFEYKDESEGNLDRFKGTEKILFKGREVYRLEYHGGKIQ